MQTPHLNDGWWTQAFPGYRYAWLWTWLGRTNEPTAMVEGLGGRPTAPPPAEVGPRTDVENWPGTVPWNL